MKKNYFIIIDLFLIAGIIILAFIVFLHSADASVEFINSSYYGSSTVTNYYRLENTSITDTAGSNTGTSTNVTFPTGKYGNAAEFNGTDAFLSQTASSGYGGNFSFTTSFWAKFDDVTSRQVIGLFGSDSTTDDGFNFVVKPNGGGSGSIGVSLAGQTDAKTSDGVVTTGVWYWIVVTHNSGDTLNQSHIFVNGVEESIASGTGSPNTTNMPMTWGAYSCCGGSHGAWFNGMLDDIVIYNIPLNGSQIQYLYNETSSAPSAPDGVTFHFPTTSTITMDFGNWKLNAVNLDLNQTYDYRITYFQSSSTNEPYIDDYRYTFWNATSAILKFPKKNSLNEDGKTMLPVETWTAQVQYRLINTSTWTFGDLIDFQVSQEASGTNATSTGAGNDDDFYPRNPEGFGGSLDCPEPASWLDVGTGIYWATCETMNLLFTPHDWSKNEFNNAFSTFKKNPPFVFAFMIYDALNAAGSDLENATTSDLSITFKRTGALAMVIPTSSLKIIDNTAYASISGNESDTTEAHNLLFATEDTIFTILLIYIIYRQTTKGRKEYH